MKTTTLTSILISGCLTVLTFLPGLARGGIVIDQGEMALALAPGENATRTIHVTNSGDKAQAVSVFASDWQQSELGGVDAVETGTAARSATRWMGVYPAKFVLEPGQKQEVSVSIAVPVGAKLEAGDYYSMVFSETEDEVTTRDVRSGRDVRLRVIGRLGTKFFVRAPGMPATVSAELTGMEVKKDHEKTAVKIAIANTGNGYFRSEKSSVTVQDARGQKLFKEPIPAFSCLPGNKRILAVPLALKPGEKYTVLAVIDYGSQEVLAGELEVVAP